MSELAFHLMITGPFVVLIWAFVVLLIRAAIKTMR